MSGRAFEETAYGEVVRTPQRTVSGDDIAAFARLAGDDDPVHADAAHAHARGFSGPIAPGPMGLALFFGLLHDSGMTSGTAIAALDTLWSYHRPLVAGARVHADILITRRRRTSTADRGVLHRAVRLRDADGRVLQSGTSALLVSCRGSEAGPEEHRDDPCARAWTAELARVLDDGSERAEAFASATASFDGTLGLRCGETTTQLRIYRGRVVDAGAWTPHGPTFTVGASEAEWASAVAAPGNDYLRRVMQGRFSVTGDTHEYARLTKALVLLWDAVRAVHAAATDGTPTGEVS